MERLRRRPQVGNRPELQLPGGSEEPEENEVIAEAPGVNVIWGPVTENVTAEGMTVGAVYRLLRVPLRIPSAVEALVDGRPVTGPDHRLAAGETLEFVRPSGEKGSVG